MKSYVIVLNADLLSLKSFKQFHLATTYRGINLIKNDV